MSTVLPPVTGWMIHEVPGCEAIFDRALSNGPIAIVAAEWPGEEREPRGSLMRSAKQLLKVIEEKTDVQRDGARLIWWTGHGDSEGIRVDTDTLLNGVAETRAPRHGRGPGTLERLHVDALQALDQHPALGRIPPKW
ncbi:hypothetical protein OG402_30910 [Streptomyces anulatus]|uniref:hypothetical protein n=1 Tax=Streptomyces TaxID=1883 RepID=UPI000BF18F3B|nr:MULTISPECIES: hypothetical protein [Streptomyces]MCX4521998.1 hypothetical protein [Streptomyces anulatus]MCX4604874.1 hypothetical protein [Streptomyces anulatus]WTE29697.1 hypothetical protein OHB50_30535 [Streptomyces anulatus]